MSISPNILGQVESDGVSEEFRNEISSFRAFLGDPDTSIPIGSNFVVRFNSFPVPLQNDKVQDFEPRWNVQLTKDTLLSIADQSNPNQRGYMFVSGIVPPVEAVDVTRAGTHSDFGDHSAGLLSDVVSRSRVQQGTVDIAFLETNKSFVDFVIRPWIVLVSHMGLIARPDEYSIKTTIDAVFYDSTNNSADNRIRKYFRFNKCAPVSISSGTSFDYGNTSINIFKTSWAYSTYDITDTIPTS